MEQAEKRHASAADYLAAERTFLAWVRTGLALMALGFVLARFGLFLQEFNTVRPDVSVASYHYSLWFGTVLILAGVAVSLLALSRYLRLLAMMRAGSHRFDRPSTLAIGIAIFLAMLGLALSYYLISSRNLSARPLRTQEAPCPPVLLPHQEMESHVWLASTPLQKLLRSWRPC